MPHQAELQFSRPPIQGERTEPRLWIKEFTVYSDYDPEKLIRSVSLRRGLNVIWAKESETGASGHAAGKSTFCRLLRYLIGDTRFGSDSFRPALRSAFPDALIAGEVILNGRSWLICRPLSTHGYHWCLPDANIAQLFEDDLKRKDFGTFTQALADTFIAPLKVSQYPGSEKKLEWQDLLQWLSRDQDARYSDILQWRAHGDPSLLNTEKTNLIRLILGLLDDEELKKQRKHSKALQERNDLKTFLPKLQYARDRSIDKLKSQFPEFKGKGNDPETSLNEVILRVSRQEKETRSKLAKEQSHDGVGKVLAAKVDTARANRNSSQRQVDRVSKQLKSHRIRLSYDQKKLTREERDRQLATLGDIEGKCSASIEDANAIGCPLAPAQNRDELQLARLEQSKDLAGHLTALIDSLAIRLTGVKEELKNAEKEFEAVSGVADKKRKAHTATRIATSNTLIRLSDTLQTLTSSRADTEMIHEKRARHTKLDEEIKASSEDLARFRKKAGKFLSNLSDDFSQVASHLTKNQINGAVSFHSDQILPTLSYDGDMSSAALVTLKLLIFDLACLLGSVRDTSQHPGFLLHDSPREADLSAHIYRRLFTLIAGTEPGEENQAVQYIVATTEAPPKHLTGNPFVVCPPLSSDTPESRFLKAII